MNYLAHIYLSGTDGDVQVGGLLGDFVKGSLQGQLPANIELGIRLHRALDMATDQHPLFRQALARLPSPWRRYGGILLDVYFDHLLAQHWHRYHSVVLGDYCRDFYRHLSRHEPLLPERAQHFCRIAPQVNWLESYADGGKIPRMLDNVGRRLRRPVPLGEAWPLLVADSLLASCFTELMCRHRAFALNFLSDFTEG